MFRNYFLPVSFAQFRIHLSIQYRILPLLNIVGNTKLSTECKELTFENYKEKLSQGINCNSKLFGLQ
jgi:hypothetical protein